MTENQQLKNQVALLTIQIGNLQLANLKQELEIEKLKEQAQQEAQPAPEAVDFKY